MLIFQARLAGYASFAERFGEEVTFGVVRPIIKTIVEPVESNNGRVEHIAGDGVLAVFGAPEALEDSPSGPASRRWESKRMSAHSSMAFSPHTA